MLVQQYHVVDGQERGDVPDGVQCVGGPSVCHEVGNDGDDLQENEDPSDVLQLFAKGEDGRHGIAEEDDRACDAYVVVGERGGACCQKGDGDPRDGVHVDEEHVGDQGDAHAYVELHHGQVEVRVFGEGCHDVVDDGDRGR